MTNQIGEALLEIATIQKKINKRKIEYQTLTKRAAKLFFLVVDFPKLNNMYQFSLASFVKLFKRSLETKPSASSTEEKLNMLSASLIRLVFAEIGRSLFKSDRLTYSL